MKFASLLLPLILVRAQQQPPEAPPAKRPDKCAIQGRILNAATGEPLKKAQILLLKVEPPFDQPKPGAVSDSGGKFAINDIPPGKYRLYASRNGFVGATYSTQRPSQPGPALSLEPGQNLKDLVLKLTPCGVIAGRVFDEEGEPLPRVFIQVFRYAWDQGKRRMDSVAGADTNDMGEYRVYGLAPGRYYVSADYRPGTTWNAGGVKLEEVYTTPAEEGYPKLYYPGTTDAPAAMLLHVTPGATVRGTDFLMKKFPTFRITGHVSGPLSNRTEERPRERPQVYVRLRENIWPPLDRVRAPVDSQGNFMLHGVISGSYYLIAELADGDRRYLARQLLDVGDTDIGGLSLNLTPGMDLSGRVRIEGDEPVRSAGELSVIIRTRGDSPFPALMERATVKDDGSFRLRNVGHDTYDVQVYGYRDNFYQKSIKLGHDDVTESGIDGSRAAGAVVEILVSPSAGQVDGVVQDEKQQPASGATVVLVPSSHRGQPRLYKEITADEHGRFTLKGITPGDYKLFAWADLERGAYYDPEFLRLVEDRGELIHVTENGHESKQLTLIPAEENKVR